MSDEEGEFIDEDDIGLEQEDQNDDADAEEGDMIGLDEKEELEEGDTGIELQLFQKSIESSGKDLVIVPDHLRRTSQIITREEKTEAIGIRATMIETNPRVFTDYGALSCPIKIAEKEFMDRRSPLILERISWETDTKIHIEQWKVREMAFPIN